MTKTRRKMTGWPLTAALVVVFVFLYAVRHVLLPFVLAGALAYILSPLVNYLVRRFALKRWMAALAVYILVLSLFAALGWWIALNVHRGALRLADGLPEHLHRIIAETLGGEETSLFGLSLNASTITANILGATSTFLRAPDRATQLAGVGLAIGFMAVLVFTLLFYFLLCGPQLARSFLMLTPPEHRERARAFAAQVHPLLFRYFYGIIIIVLFTSAATWVGVGPIFHLPHPIFLAVATGILELLPVAGPVLSAALLGGTAVLHGGAALTFAGFALFCLALRLAIDQVVGPLVLGQAMVLSPVTVMFAFLAGGVLAGVLGVFLAIPVAAVLKVLIDNYYAIPVED